MRLFLPAAAFLLTTLAAHTQTPADTQPLTTLTVGTRVVEIAAVVKSKDGQPLGGLTKDDFILKQDGKEEPIHYFSQGSDLPLTLALLVDTSGSQRTFISDETQASDIFFETMLGRPQDRAALFQFDTRVLQLRPLTNSASALHLSLLNLSATDPATAAGTRLTDAVFAVSQNILAREHGRKAIILLTDGGERGSHVSLDQAIEQAQRADVQIYAILYSAGTPLGVPLAMGLGGVAMATHATDSGLATLQKLTEATGGRVFTVAPATPLREIYARIAQDLRLEYELGYTPPADLAPNSFHKLDLRTRDRKLTVQARKGFFTNPQP